MDYVSAAFFGYSVYALVAYLGGLMAVDICPRKATGAAMGVIGLFSYAGASIQEYVSGLLINSSKQVIAGVSLRTSGPFLGNRLGGRLPAPRAGVECQAGYRQRG